MPQIRWMIRRDMLEVMEIENQCFEFPWCEDDFIRILRLRNCIGLVAEHKERIAGFMIYQLHRHRLHIVNFAVSVGFRRRGVGSEMLRRLIGKLTQPRGNEIVVHVRDGNLGAHLFLRSLGFRAETILRDYYQESSEDAYRFHYRLDGPLPCSACLQSGDVRRVSA